MSYHILENYIQNIYFCRDGKLRTFISDKIRKPNREFASIIDIENNLISDHDEKIMLFFSLVNRQVYLEEDITFGEMIECLRPWGKQISRLISKNATSFFDSVSHSEKYDPQKHYVQILTSEMLSKTISYEEMKEDFDISKFLNRKRKDWDGSFTANNENNLFSVVSYEKENQVLWNAIYDNFEGLKDLKIKYIRDSFRFSIDNLKEDDDFINNDEAYKEQNMIKIKNNNNMTLIEMLNGLFHGSNEICTPVSAIEMQLLKIEEISPEKLDKTKEIYIKESLEIRKKIESAKLNISTISFLKIEDFSFNYNTITYNKFVVYNKVYNNKNM